MKSFRDAVMAHDFVRQLYDPWYVDDDTRDKVAADFNTQCGVGSTGHVHRNHLHFTVHEPGILPDSRA